MQGGQLVVGEREVPLALVGVAVERDEHGRLALRRLGVTLEGGEQG